MKKGIKMYLDNRQESFVHLFDVITNRHDLSPIEKLIWLHLAKNADNHHPSQKAVMTKLNIPRPGTLPKAYVKLENLGMITRQTINGRGKQEITVMPPDKWPTTKESLAMTTTKTVAVENNDHYQNGSATTTKTVAVTTTKTVAPTVLDTVLINRSSNACEETSLASTPPPKKNKPKKQKPKTSKTRAQILTVIADNPYSGVYGHLLYSDDYRANFKASRDNDTIAQFLERNPAIKIHMIENAARDLADKQFFDDKKDKPYKRILSTALNWAKRSGNTQFNTPNSRQASEAITRTVEVL